MTTTTYPEAIPTGQRVTPRDVGPCQIPDCPNRATWKIEWLVVGYGTALAWYCDDHAPEVTAP